MCNLHRDIKTYKLYYIKTNYIIIKCAKRHIFFEKCVFGENYVG